MEIQPYPFHIDKLLDVAKTNQRFQFFVSGPDKQVSQCVETLGFELTVQIFQMIKTIPHTLRERKQVTVIKIWSIRAYRITRYVALRYQVVGNDISKRMSKVRITSMRQLECLQNV